MEKTFQELPNWTFRADEVSAGFYKVKGENTLTGSNLELYLELSGENLEQLFKEAMAIAVDMERRQTRRKLIKMLKRTIAGLVGVSLLAATLYETYLQSFGFYAEHYTVPVEKYGVRTALRWQDIVFLCVFWPIALAFFYISYRCLTYAVRRSLVAPTVSFIYEPYWTAVGYNWALLWELLARLLIYPDDQYWTTVQRCLPFFTVNPYTIAAKTRGARLMTSFADDIKDLTLEQLQSLYREAFWNRDWSLELSRLLHLDDGKRAEMISWIEARTGQIPSSRVAPILHLPYDHISVALLLMTVPGSYWETVSDGWLFPAMQNLEVAMEGSRNPFEKLVQVTTIAVKPG